MAIGNNLVKIELNSRGEIVEGEVEEFGEGEGVIEGGGGRAGKPFVEGDLVDAQTSGYLGVGEAEFAAGLVVEFSGEGHQSSSWPSPISIPEASAFFRIRAVTRRDHSAMAAA